MKHGNVNLSVTTNVASPAYGRSSSLFANQDRLPPVAPATVWSYILIDAQCQAC